MSEDQQKIQTIYNRIDEAMVAKDTEALENILDDDYTLVHMSGYRQRKQEWLEQIDNEQMRYFKPMPQRTTITINGK
jgi:hypothetical protein